MKEMPESCVRAKKNPRCRCQSLLMLYGGKNGQGFFNLSPLRNPYNFPSSPFSPRTSALDLVFLCRRTECGEETGEQSAAVWSSSCCLPDQRGQQAWSSWPDAPLEVFDGQSTAGAAQPAM